jgi:hypothetical protein
MADKSEMGIPARHRTEHETLSRVLTGADRANIIQLTQSDLPFADTTSLPNVVFHERAKIPLNHFHYNLEHLADTRGLL